MPAERETFAARRRLGVGAVVVIVIAAFVVTVGIGIFRGASSPVEVVSAPSASPTVAVREGRVYVHVAGAVAAPGLYALPAGARVVDAVAAAGGFAPDADRAAVNLARPVSDGEQLLVTVVGAAPPPAAASGGGVAGGPLDLNAADETALDALPGIGPALAGRIVAWREENGRFTSVDDLLSVSGIGEKVLDGLRDLVRV